MRHAIACPTQTRFPSRKGVRMRTWHFVLSLILLAAVGCSSNSNKPKELTQQEQARKNWNMARAAVLYKLAKEQYDTGNLDDCRKSLDDANRMAPDNLAV